MVLSTLRCPDCLAETCAFNRVTNTKCDSSFVRLDAGSHRTNADYDAVLRSTWAKSASDLPNSLIDSLLKYQQAGLDRPPTTAASILLYNDGGVLVGSTNPWYHEVDGSDGEELYSLYIIFCHHVSARNDIINLLGQLRFTATNAMRKTDSAALLAMCAGRVQSELEHSKLKPRSASELVDRTMPLARTYQHIVKNHVSSDMVSLTKLTDGKFSIETGDRVTEFEHIKHISTSLQLMLILRDFEATIYAIGKNGGKTVWEPFFTSMFGLMEGHDADYVHLFIFHSLKKIDKSPSMTIVSFMSTYFQTELAAYSSVQLF